MIHRTLLGSLSLALMVAGLAPAPAAAQAGAIYFRNLTNEAIKVEGDFCVAPSGRRDLRGISWEMAANRHAYLAIDDSRITASEFHAWVTTADGSTSWAWRCQGLDQDGDFVLEFAPATLRRHYEILRKRPLLGVHQSDHEDGVKLTAVLKNLGAERAGLRVGDVIIRLDDKKVASCSELTSYLWNNKSPGEKVRVTFRRGGREQVATVVLSPASTRTPPAPGPSQRAVENAAVKVAAGAVAWWLVDDSTKVPCDNIFEEIARIAARELAMSVLQDVMKSAVHDLVPSLGLHDRNLLSSMLVDTVVTGGARIPRGAGRDTFFRLLRDHGLSGSDADFLAGAASSLVSAIRSAR